MNPTNGEFFPTASSPTYGTSSGKLTGTGIPFLDDLFGIKKTPVPTPRPGPAPGETRRYTLEGRGPSVTTYDTPLSPEEEQKFQTWKKVNRPNDSGEDYDLRGAFKAGLVPDEKTGHWPDTYKKPNHPTFSNESIYAKDRPDLAGRWEGDKYVPPTRHYTLQGKGNSPERDANLFGYGPYTHTFEPAIDDTDYQDGLEGAVSEVHGEGQLLNLIARGEAPGGYNQRFGEKADQPQYQLTSMTIDDVLALPTNTAGGYTSSASGRYQFLRKTLASLKTDLSLSGTEKFDEKMQDRLAGQLLKRRGLGKYLSGDISREQFAKNLSKEWASLPNPATGGSFYGQPTAHPVVSVLGAIDRLKTTPEEYAKMPMKQQLALLEDMYGE